MHLTEGNAAHSRPVRFWLCELMQRTTTLPTPNASLCLQPGHSRIAPGGLERAKWVQQQKAISLAWKQTGIPLCAVQTICPCAVNRCSRNTLSALHRQLSHAQWGPPAAPTPSAGKCECCRYDSMSSFHAAGSRVTSRTGLDCNRRSFTVSTCWLAGQVTA